MKKMFIGCGSTISLESGPYGLIRRMDSFEIIYFNILFTL